MELCADILAKILQSGEIHVAFPDLREDIKEIVELQCCRTLARIREILDADSLNDRECFEKIEEIVCLFEQMGSSGGSRHDLG